MSRKQSLPYVGECCQFSPYWQLIGPIVYPVALPFLWESAGVFGRKIDLETAIPTVWSQTAVDVIGQTSWKTVPKFGHVGGPDVVERTYYPPETDDGVAGKTADTMIDPEKSYPWTSEPPHPEGSDAGGTWNGEP